ncbi:hypothetical protein IQ260_16230 [Leptolyngbya cf. ectocarpi LEGE 11479]|uniref:Uncharacterized protein n=1 Tax=Leptolyngbya cf. ectocarpi LEGE 11479 TaxID=1828722 RepID=A0A929FAH7_LEPEC|nr:hypothetical protein [Leptolyngbya ectocarpi]MBE9068199.1 hypothetical protein [Leptolyngbya cf. ectocarpi LEGE 11479]
MQGKQKVTLYMPDDLHRQLKIRAAVDGSPMSTLAERAIGFYLNHSDVVDGVQGTAHLVYECPACTTSLVLRDSDLMAVESHGELHAESLTEVPDVVPSSVRSDEGELVPC